MFDNENRVFIIVLVIMGLAALIVGRIILREPSLSAEAIGLGIVVFLLGLGRLRALKKYSKLNREAHDYQMQSIHSAKTSALGEMAGSIAHEVSNPLMVIMANAQLLERHVEKASEIDREKVKTSLTKIIGTVERIVRIMKGLSTMTRDSSQDPPTDTTVKAILDNTLDFCREKFKNRNIELRLAEVPDIHLTCREVQISQVLLNLLNNALDAVKGQDGAFISIEIFDLDSAVKMQITDSGSGIPTELADKIMKPFFTTKPKGKGTGIGLSISKSIIENHKGKLYLDRNCRNTRFIIELPKTVS